MSGFERRSVQALGSGHLEIRFIDGCHFELRCEGAEHVVYLLRKFAVTLGMPVDENGVWALLGRRTQRHGGVNTELSGFVRRRADNAALVPLTPDDESLPFQRWIVEFFHGHEEGIHVHM